MEPAVWKPRCGATACHIECDQHVQCWPLPRTPVLYVQAEDDLGGRQARVGRRMEGSSLANVAAYMKDRAAIAWHSRPPPGPLLVSGTLLSFGFWLVCKLLRPLSFLLSVASLLVIILVVTQSAGSNSLIDTLSEWQFKPSYRETKNFVERTTWTVLAGWLVLVLLAHVI